ncbi:MAG: sugar ABC transporter ATP-binding protein [Planctomycetota bacterium]
MSATQHNSVVVQLRGIVKRYPGVVALDAVNLDLREGEVHIVAGENGAGKSTLMKVLAGAVMPDQGRIEMAGVPTVFTSPIDAMKAGVAIVYQEFALCPHLTVAENIFLGCEPGGFFIDTKQMRQRTADLLQRVGAHCSPDDITSTLGTAQMQLVEIARALNSDFRVLILDEPTAALSESETSILFKTIKSLRAAGKTIAYISHRLEEFAEIGDRVTVMRNGKWIETLPIADVSIRRLVNAMAGKDMSELFPVRKRIKGKTVLKLNSVSQGERLRDVSFKLHAGEILGVAGLVGSGRTRLLRTIFGLEKPTEGSIAIKGKKLTCGSVTEAIDAGIGLVPEDRKVQGLMLDLSIARNISIANLDQVSTGSIVSTARETALAETQRDAATIKTPTVHAQARTLSGGNQQKIVLAKWLARGCDVLLLDEPARGVDVGARHEIFKLIAQCAERGCAVILASSYLPEILGMADRILVMHRGEVAAIFPAKGATQEKILHAASVM